MRRRRIKIKNTNNLKESNKKIIKIIENGKPFIISRLGLGAETKLTYKYLRENELEGAQIKILENNAGIYNGKTKEFIENYKECIKYSDFLAVFVDVMKDEQKYFSEKYKLKTVCSRILEPFYCLLEDIDPWTYTLIDKKVLIINPFVSSFKKQIDNDWKIFKNKHIFLKDQKFIFYKSYNTFAGNHLHSSWVETFQIMKEDILKLDFDIALLGCGGYGLPLCNFIKKQLNKSAIYIGGGLQLLFGVKGKRWNNHPVIGKIIKENRKFILPSGEELLRNKEKVEGGCYW